MRISALPSALIALLLGSAAQAQSVHWDPAQGTLPVGQASALQLVFDDCEPKDTPAPPHVDGLTVQYGGQSSNMSWINGTYSHSVTDSYTVLLAKKQEVEIPSFEVETSKGRLRVPAARFQPTDATVGSSGQPLETAANSRLEAAPAAVWAGEVFNLTYSIEATRSYYPDFGHGAFDWNPGPVVAEDWSQPEPYDVNSGGDAHTGLAYRTRAILHQTGSTRVNPISQLINLSVGMNGLGFFQQRQYQQFSVVSSAPTIEVRPLPPAPAGFNGAVGDFKLTSKIVPSSGSVGEPITWTVELSGTGNWPDIPGLPARDVSKDFQVVQPKDKRAPAAGKIFDSTLTEDVVLVPTKGGTYTIPPVTFIAFDPKSGAYRTLTAPGATVAISPGAASASNPAPAAESAEPGGTGPAITLPPSVPPPSGLPRDALPGAGTAATPISTNTLAWLLAAPFLLALSFWLWLALRRAQSTDPRRRQREARARLTATLNRLESGTGVPLAAAKHREDGPVSSNAHGRDAHATLLLSWQHDAAILWDIDHAAPSADRLPSAWGELWAQADRVLYGPDATLPADWCARAKTALAAKAAPRFAPRQLFLPRNLLFPFFAAGLLLVTTAPWLRADDPGGSAAYGRGDFAAAEKGWREALAQNPADWAARHDLSLALAQQNHWDEAAAQAAAAFVQNPASDAVRWQFALASEKAGFAPDPLAAFLAPGPVERFSQLASAPDWQLILAGAAWLAAAALASLLALGYRTARRPAWIRRALYCVAAAAVGLGIVAGIGWSAYGPAADARAVVVWRTGTLRSIPTEADTSQKTTPLPAGSLALADKSFLGWIRLTFDNGQTGWVRKDEVVGLWR